MKIALAQIAPKLKKLSLEEFNCYLKNIKNDVDLVIFPELALNGYLLKDAVFENAYTLDEIGEFAKFSKDFDIVFGAAFSQSYKFFNSSFYCSGGEIKSVHHKTALPNYGLFQEARFFFKGESLDCFETKFGKTFVLICEEVYDASIIEKVSNEKPDLIIVISNSPARGFEDGGLLIQKQWDSLLGTIALLSGANTVFVNRVGFEDGLGFWGGSCALSPDSKIISCAKLFAKEYLEVQIDSKISQTQKYLLREY
jgi:predicted amidohydrolase